MTKEFLEALQLPQEVAEAIWQEHEKAVQHMAFDHDLETAIAQAGGRNHKAIAALLDIPALREAPEELPQALERLKEEQSYLFRTPVAPVYARTTGTNTQPAQGPVTLASALRERFEKRK